MTARRSLSPTRREFPAKVKVAAFERAKGQCEGCTARLYPGRYHYDHRIPDALGGEPTLDNCEVLCLACHGRKTAGTDQPAIAKVRHVRAKHLGAYRSARPMDGSKASRWRKRMDGTVEAR
jgi:5-methylcytosine-specific restriction protein A